MDSYEEMPNLNDLTLEQAISTAKRYVHMHKPTLADYQMAMGFLTGVRKSGEALQ